MNVWTQDEALIRAAEGSRPTISHWPGCHWAWEGWPCCTATATTIATRDAMVKHFFFFLLPPLCRGREVQSIPLCNTLSSNHNSSHTPHLRSPNGREAIPRYALQRQGAPESQDELYVEQNSERFRACSNYNTLPGNVSTTSSRNTGDTSSAHNTHPLWEFRLPWISSANNWSQHQVSSKETKASLHFLLATVVLMVPLPCSWGLEKHVAHISLVSISDMAKKGNQCL